MTDMRTVDAVLHFRDSDDVVTLHGAMHWCRMRALEKGAVYMDVTYADGTKAIVGTGL